MARGTEALVEPSLLVWARQNAGYSTIEAAAQKARFTTEQLESWEKGDSRPTVSQLRKLAQVYRRPLAVFYLPEPPKNIDEMQLRDYRRLPDAARRESPELRAEIRRALYRREVFLELAEDWEDVPPSLEASASTGENPERVGARIRNLLGVSLQEQVGWVGEYGALSSWRFALEEVGVLVFQASGIDISEMRGFSLTERPFPVIVVNIRDSPRGRIFSLMHEFTHILLRDSSLCDLSYYQEPRSANLQQVERFCNNVAAAALVPKDDLLAQPLVARKPNRTARWSWDELRELSARYEVSDQALLRRLLTLHKVDDGFYWQTARQLQKRHKKKKPDPGSSGGPPPSKRAVYNAGQLFTELVLDSYYDERITAADLSDYLEVKLKHIPDIEDLVRRKSTT
jgi:Zn-dependent peptidase ImmA (M78 family)